MMLMMPMNWMLMAVMMIEADVCIRLVMGDDDVLRWLVLMYADGC